MDTHVITDLEQQIAQIAADRARYDGDADRRIARLQAAIENVRAAAAPDERPPAAVVELAPRRRDRAHLRDRVLRILARRGQGTASDVALELGDTAASYEIANALRDLVARRAIERTGAHGPALSGRGRAPLVYRVTAAKRRTGAA
jgi:hypothetical protein